MIVIAWATNHDLGRHKFHGGNDDSCGKRIQSNSF